MRILSRERHVRDIGTPGCSAPDKDSGPALRFEHRAIVSDLSLALIGNASGQTFVGEGGLESEAFSIRRLGGSRWRLRRTRCAMGFEWRLVAESSTGRTLVNGDGGVVMGESAADARQSMRGPWHGSVWAWGGHTNASMYRGTSGKR